MFRLTMFCDDKKLPNLLRSITGQVIGAPEVVPVVNAAVKGGKITAQTNGSSVERFVHYFKEHGIKTFSGNELREITGKVGLTPNSVSYFVRKLTDAGVIKRAGKGAKLRYTVVQS